MSYDLKVLVPFLERPFLTGTVREKENLVSEKNIRFEHGKRGLR
jgi:hypothetical protein